MANHKRIVQGFLLAVAASASECPPPPPEYWLTVSVLGNGRVTSSPAGIDAPGDTTELYGNERSVALSAVGNEGSQFTEWGGVGITCGETPTCVITMTESKRVTATFVPVPTVDTVIPSAGPLGGGTAVTITGESFVGVSAVTIGGAPLGNRQVVNSVTITGTTPTGTTGARDVVVAAAGGADTLAGGFTYEIGRAHV